MAVGDIVFQNGSYFYQTGLGLSRFVIPAGVVDVTFTGAVGDGIVDDTPAVIRAVAEVRERGGGTVYFPRPPVAYMLQPQEYHYGADYPNWKACVEIAFDNVALVGDAHTNIRTRTPGGGNPSTDFALCPLWATDIGTPVPPPAWQQGHGYSPGDMVVGPNGHGYRCTVGGTSSGSGPNDLFHATARAIIDGTVTWELADAIYKGPAFRVKAGCTNVRFQNLIIDGQAPYEASSEQPPLGLAPYALAYDTPSNGILAGHGWVLAGHWPVVLGPENPTTGETLGDVTFEDCEFRNWRSECIYTSLGSGNAGTIRLIRPRFVSCTGSVISVTAPIECEDAVIEGCGQAVENDGSIFNQTFRRTTIRNCNTGFIFPSQNATRTGRGRTLIEDTIIDGVPNWGFRLTGYTTNVWISRAKVIDAAQTAGTAAISVASQFAAKPFNVHLTDIEIISDQKTVGLALDIEPGDYAEVSRCRLIRTARSVLVGVGIFVSHICTVDAGTYLDLNDNDFTAVFGGILGNIGGAGSARLRGSRLDGLFVGSLVPPDLDQHWADRWELMPAAPTTFNNPLRFPVGVEAMVAINANVTITNGANIVLAGGVDLTPAATIGTIWFVRPTLASERIVESRRAKA